jgi:beta-lactamase regulating signal transducer with metallopeptidase domain/protocatechuate 3,4-dioxygenase beta subunit
MDLHLHELAHLAWLQFLQVSALVAAVGLLVRLGCRRRPHLAYMLWILVLLKCLIPPLWSSPTGIFSWAQLHFAGPERETQTSMADPPISIPGPVQDAISMPAQRNRFTAHDSASVAELPATVIDNPGASWLPGFSWPALFAAVWLAGASVLSGVVLWKWLTYWRVLKHSTVPADSGIELLSARLARRLGLRRKISLLVTSQTLGPAVFGFFRPAVVLPWGIVAEKTPQQIEPIIAHELIHIRRGDTVWGLLQLAAEILWWFHPLVWWANRQTCHQRERCCDEEVVAALKCRPAAYAHCLLDVLEAEQNWRPILAIPGVRSIEVTSKRLEHIMTRASSFHQKTPRWCWAFLAVAAVLILPGRELVLGANALAGQTQKQTFSAEERTAQMEEKTIISGQVVDPTGKSLPGAQVVVVGRPRSVTFNELLTDSLKLLGLTKADEQGRFSLNVPRLSSAGYYDAKAVAASDGFNFGWQTIGLDVEQPNVLITLTTEQTIHGQVLDSKGQPAANVKVFMTGGKYGEPQCWRPPSQIPFWPKPVTTDKDGRFTLRGIDRDQAVSLQVLDDRFAIDWMYISPSDMVDERVQVGPSGEVTLMPSPARIFEGEITYADTHRPVANARVEIGASNDPTRCIMNMAGLTDAAGRFRLNQYAGKIFYITVVPPEGEPYLIFQKELKLADGEQSPKIEIALPRGILLQGKVIDKESGRPVAGAAIKYEEYAKPPYAPERILPDHLPHDIDGVTKADGTFAIGVPPGPGVLFVQGPGNDFVSQTVSSAEFQPENYYKRRYYTCAFKPVDLIIDQEPAKLEIALRRGVTVRGKIVGPDKRPTGDVQILSRHFVSGNEYYFRCGIGQITAQDGQFELHGLDPDVAVPFIFLDSKNELGTVAEISGKSDRDKPLVVRLTPCGQAVARFVDPDGKPLVKYEPSLQIVVTPGPCHYDLKRAKKQLVSDEDFVSNFDRLHYWHKIMTDDQGRCTFPALIPGATYRIPIFHDYGDWGESDFTVKSGQTLDLGDIVLQKSE